MDHDKRQFRRVSFGSASSVEYRGAQVRGEVIDISLKGALINLEEPLAAPEGEHCTVTVELGIPDTVITFEARIAHTRGNLVGLRLVRIDLDSMVHLRTLIELNTADPGQVLKELAFFGGAE